MITYYLSTDHGLEILAQPAAGCWINVVAPSAEEAAELQAMLRVPQDFITYPLDVGEMARTERENGATLMVLRVPYYQGQTADIPYTTVPVGIILTESYITTVCKTETDVIQALVAGRARGLLTGKPNRLTLQLLLLTASQFLAYLREINKSVDRLEDQLQRSLRNREVLELLKFQKSLTFFATGLTSNELMLQHLQKSRLFEPFAEEQDLLDDVLTEVQQAIGMTNISSNILSQMMDAFASIISNNLNVVMKFLASVTIILSLPTKPADHDRLLLRHERQAAAGWARDGVPVHRHCLSDNHDGNPARILAQRLAVAARGEQPAAAFPGGQGQRQDACRLGSKLRRETRGAGEIASRDRARRGPGHAACIMRLSPCGLWVENRCPRGRRPACRRGKPGDR